MATPATTAKELDLIAPGSRVVVRDVDWQVIDVARQALGSNVIVRCVGRSELVRDQFAAFHSDLDRIEPEDPTKTRFRMDTSMRGIETRLLLESLIRRTPVPVSNTSLTVGHAMLADDLPYQREPFRAAMAQLQPRILVADAVGLGKTIEVGMLLAELQRRGRANRVLAVVPRHILDQVQHELWCRAGFPLVRLDSDGIQRLRQKIPAGRNPFTYFNRVIVSIDTIKNQSRYAHHLEKVRWDVVWIDESHKLVNRGTLNNKLAQVLAPSADALILTSATPHNGKPESFAELISLLDPTAVTDPAAVEPKDIAHLIVRRHKHSPDVDAAIGDQWAERADPNPVSVTPTVGEEAIFAELSARWIGAGVKSPTKDRLFAWVILKAALSSPAALAETVQNRAKKQAIDLEANDPSDDPEVEALRRLWILSQHALDSGSAKLTALVELLRGIGIGPKSKTRAVIFSERISTLDWIATALRAELGMTDQQVQTFHNSKSDIEQQQIIEGFSMAGQDIRVLVTSDIAAEGVNLHKQCNQMIHVDLPWSLITLEQRNGRIDRYGQRKSPQISYLIYNPADAEIASDVRIVKKLIEKEHTAHKALGDAASVMGLHSEDAEEQSIIAALQQHTEQERAAALEVSAPTPDVFDPWAFVGLGESDASAMPAPGWETVPVAPTTSLFSGDDAYLRDAMALTFPSLADINWETDTTTVSFKPPDDLMRRLSALPQSYLRQRDLAHRLRLTADSQTAQRSLDDAINQKSTGDESGTAWPEVHHLGPQHPVLEWIADKILYRVGRNEAIAIACGVSEPTLLISAVWSNQLGEPIASAWLAATVEDGLVTFADLHDTLRRAGVAEGMVNTAWDGDTALLEALIAPTVKRAEAHMAGEMERPLTEAGERLDLHRARLESWQSGARHVAEQMSSAPHRHARLAEIERVTQQITALIADHTPAERPLIRVVGALLPKQAA